jgi:hypothetical protein
MLAFIVMIMLYIVISYLHADRGGMASIFQGAIFQLSRNIQVYMQKKRKAAESERWRPSIVCISANTFYNDKALQLMGWIANRYGFGTYIHLVENYFSNTSNQEAADMLDKLIELAGEDTHVYMDTLISPSFTSAVAQIVQLPGISGMPNNMILFEFEKDRPDTVQPILVNVSLAKAARLDIAVLAATHKKPKFKKGIHVWIRSIDADNSNLMILLSYIILGHPDWRKGKIKIFEITQKSNLDDNRRKLLELIQSGRLPISPKNIEIISIDENVSYKRIINEQSKEAGLTMVGFLEEQLKFDKRVFLDYDELEDVLFVNASHRREIG